MFSSSSSGACLALETPPSCFVHDATVALPDQPDESEIIFSGLLKLTLPKPRQVQTITVRLVNRYNLITAGGLAHSTGILFDKTLTLHEEPQVMQGENVFHFTFLLPSSYAVYQRCRYGRIHSRAEATVRFSGLLSKDLTTSNPVHIIHNPGPSGGVPPPLELQAQEFSDDLGPHIVQAEATTLTASQLIHFQLSFAQPTTALSIDQVEACILQAFQLTDPKTKVPVPAEPQLIRLFCLDASNRDQAIVAAPLASDGLVKPQIATQPISTLCSPGPFTLLEPGKEVAFRILLRLPNDDIMRATTGATTDTPIRVSHVLIIKIQYTTPEGETKVVQMEKPVFVTSCCCSLESLLLPSYSKDRPCVGSFSSETKGHRHAACICGASLQKIMSEAHSSGLTEVYSQSAAEPFIPKPASA